MSSSQLEAMKPHQQKAKELPGREPALAPVVNEESHKIPKNKRKPVVVYMVSPKVIHAEASEFMALVQSLTGPGGSSSEEASRASAQPSTSAPRGGRRGPQHLPVRVKARPLNRSGPRIAMSTTTTLLQVASSQPVAAAAETPFFRDLSPPSYVVRKDEPMAPHSRLLHGEYLDQSPRHGSPYLDIFGQGPDR